MPKLTIRHERQITKDEEPEFIAALQDMWSADDPRRHPRADQYLYVVSFGIGEAVFAATVLVSPGQTLEQMCVDYFKSRSF